jgi:ABC-type glutathione transport system ATPase component
VSEPYIRVQNLSKLYQSGGADLVVFSGVDLQVSRGEMLAVVGESGDGKPN